MVTETVETIFIDAHDWPLGKVHDYCTWTGAEYECCTQRIIIVEIKKVTDE